jgi:lysozyme
MDFAKLDALILKHEGKRYKVYKDTLGNLTVGIGHLVLPSDNLKEGDIIDDARVNTLYGIDRMNAINSTKNIFPAFDAYPSDIQIALVDLMFNWGENQFRSMHDTINLIKTQDWPAVAAKLDSASFSTWRSEVGNRSLDIVNLFKSHKGAVGVAVGILAVGLTVIYILYRRSQGNA